MYIIIILFSAPPQKKKSCIYHVHVQTKGGSNGFEFYIDSMLLLSRLPFLILIFPERGNLVRFFVHKEWD